MEQYLLSLSFMVMEMSVIMLRLIYPTSKFDKKYVFFFKYVFRLNRYLRKLAKKNCLHFSAKFRTSLQNYEQFCNSLWFFYNLLYGYSNSLVILFWYEKCLH